MHNIYHGVHIETDHHVICSMTEDAAKQFAFPNFTTPVPGTLRKVLDNNTTTRDKFYLNGLGMKKGESGGVSILFKTGMEVAQYYTVLLFAPTLFAREFCTNPTLKRVRNTRTKRTVFICIANNDI